MPSRLLGTRWALTPPFHPYRAHSPATTHSRESRSDLLKVFLQPVTEAICTGGLFSVALSVTESTPCQLLHEDPAPWRYQARCPLVRGATRRRLSSKALGVEDYGVRTFLPACLLAKACPAITRPARQSQYSLSSRFGRENWRPNADGQRQHRPVDRLKRANSRLQPKWSTASPYKR
jgi:hypothetical protein